jgi:hypothetical protein
MGWRALALAGGWGKMSEKFTTWVFSPKTAKSTVEHIRAITAHISAPLLSLIPIGVALGMLHFLERIADNPLTILI